MQRLSCLLVALAMSSVTLAAPAADRAGIRQLVSGSLPGFTEVTPARLAAALLVETNRVRRAHGCRPLRPLRELNAAADDQASYMAIVHHAGHGNAFFGQANVLERVLRRGVRPAEVAENVAAMPAAINAVPSPCTAIAAGLVEAWMNSPGHRANLLNRNFTHLGCAARVVPVLGHTEYVFGAQVFSRLPHDDTWQI